MVLEMMLDALRIAEKAAVAGEVPVGAVIVDDKGKIVSSAHNLTETDKDPTAHAELLVIREACRIVGSPRLAGFDMYVTLEPCAMCAAAISYARIRRLYFGAYDTKMGGVENGVRFFNSSACHHVPEVYGGIEEEKCGELLKAFFGNRRN